MPFSLGHLIQVDTQSTLDHAAVKIAIFVTIQQILHQRCLLDIIGRGVAILLWGLAGRHRGQHRF